MYSTGTHHDDAGGERPDGRSDGRTGRVSTPGSVFIVEDHALMRRLIAARLQDVEAFEVSGTAGSVAEALASMNDSDPAVVLLDLSLPDGNGIELLRSLRARDPQRRCVIFSAHDDDGTVAKALAAGACGFLSKQCGERLGEVLRRVAAGERELVIRP